MKRVPILFYLALLSGGLLTVSCSEDNPDASGGTATLEVQTAEDILANPGGAGPPGQAPPPNYTFYSLADEKVVDKADSNSTQWDIALDGTTILVNGGTSGPGQGEAQVVTGIFDELTEAPESGYATDSEAGFGIPTGDEKGWYNYTSEDTRPFRTVIPLPGKIIVLRTAEGNYAKMEILSYYKGSPTITADFAPEPGDNRHYTFQYVVQPNGSRQF